MLVWYICWVAKPLAVNSRAMRRYGATWKDSRGKGAAQNSQTLMLKDSRKWENKKRRSPISSTFLPIHHRCDIFLRSKKGNESIHIVTFSVICTKLQMLCPTTIVFSSKCVAKIVDTVKPEVSISDHPVWLISAFSLQFQDWTQYNTNKIHKHK